MNKRSEKNEIKLFLTGNVTDGEDCKLVKKIIHPYTGVEIGCVWRIGVSQKKTEKAETKESKENGNTEGNEAVRNEIFNENLDENFNSIEEDVLFIHW